MVLAAQSSTPEDYIVLGVDPGTVRMGYGVLELRERTVQILAFGAVKMEHLTDDQPLRLQTIFQRLTGIIDEYKPDALAIETPFVGVNVQSALKLGRAQGVAIAAAMNRALAIYEYAPSKAKLAVTGRGNATKEQVAAMLRQLFPELQAYNDPYTLDATDALGLALCHILNHSSVLSAHLAVRAGIGTKATGRKTKKQSWASFVAQHPDRVKDS